MGEEVCVFLRDLLRHLRGPVIAILDNSTTHHGEALAELQRRHPRLHIEHFPSYAPELNPDEGVWSLAKRDVANGCPHDVHELMDALIRAIDRETSRLHSAIGAAPFFALTIALFMQQSIIMRWPSFGSEALRRAPRNSMGRAVLARWSGPHPRDGPA
ncbi:MAG: hypothetical protein DMG58_25050 [Acidobacteria bacterium]|nr:MAG: hypothetical protein DMG58_25050 [Acidobacteriota bacterium]